MKNIVFFAGLLCGCVYDIAPGRVGHASNGDAASPPLPALSRSPASHDRATGSETEALEIDRGSTDHRAMHGRDESDDAMGKHHVSRGHHHWEVPDEAESRKNPVFADPASIARGKALFEKNCVSCHGAKGRGDGPAAGALDRKPHDLVMAGRHHSAGNLAWKIANGRGQMPAWKGVLSENEIWDLVNFTQSLGGGADHHKHHHHRHSE